MPAAGFCSLPAVKPSHVHVCISYPFEWCTCLLHRMKLPFTPQIESGAPPFLQPGLSTDEVNSMLKRPGSVIKALCIPALLYVCPCMCTITVDSIRM